MERFSFRETFRISLTWKSQLLPKMVTVGVCASSRACTFGHSQGGVWALRVLPKAARRAFLNFTFRASSKKRMSFGFEPGQPPSM